MPMVNAKGPDGKIVVINMPPGVKKLETPKGTFVALEDGERAFNPVTPALETTPDVLASVEVLQKASINLPPSGEKVAAPPAANNPARIVLSKPVTQVAPVELNPAQATKVIPNK